MTPGTVIVTGVTTFIGCHLAPAFAAAGYRVVGAVNTPAASMDALHLERWRMAESSLARVCSLDVTDSLAVAALIAAETPQIWINLAGIGKNFAGDSYDLAQAMRIDVLPLDAIYQAMAAVGGSVLAAGSSMEYGAIAGAHREDAACWPDTPYGVAKLAATLRMRQLARRYQVPTRVARIYTLFGELDSSTRLVAHLLERLRNGARVGVAPGAYRDICDVDDVVRGYLALASDCGRDSLFDIFNLSRGTATELKQIALFVAEQCGADPALISEDESAARATEPSVICGDSGKARHLLDWSARPIADGLSRMVGGRPRSTLRHASAATFGQRQAAAGAA